MTNCLRPRTTALLLLTLSLAACESLNDAASKAAENFQSAMQGAHDASGKLQTGYTVRGRVLLRDGQTLTCFNGITTGYLGSPTMASPGEGSYDPRTGKATLKTAAIPTVVMTQNNTVISNDCDKLAAEGVLIAAGGGAATGPRAATGSGPAGTVPLATTELVNFFERYPQPGGGRSTSWPRVAITLMDAPSWGTDKLSQFNNFRSPAYGCWTFKARIWESDKSSRELPSFHYCTDQSLKIPGGDNHAYYETWSGLVVPGEKRGSTGINRGDGPGYPDTPLPVAKRSNQAKLNPVTFTGRVVEGVVYATGLDMSKFDDPRLWINFSPAMEARP
ncbi:MAG: hypothetical protein H6933_21450 [Burkholderiaceae bacterium]|nr:hypothetical protein [Pseudomonadota bacterium]MCB1995414.1 hypothetical protein [Rhodoferax sp.]MCP5287465.1 hypothetical protein [Burkholderiaceae bacterium]